MNVKLLNKVRDYIEANPSEYDQGNWCGTKCCIAGHAVLLSGKYKPQDFDLKNDRVDGKYTDEAARLVLYITEKQAIRLFLSWPDGFEEGWSTKPSIAVPVAVKRINHFIKTRGAE